MALKQRRELERLISQKKEETLRRYALRHAVLAELSARNIGDFVDEVTREDALGMQYTLEEHDRQELQRLEEALGRLGSDSFGYCQACQEPIEAMRLLIIPETSLCCACATDLERREGSIELV